MQQDVVGKQLVMQRQPFEIIERRGNGPFVAQTMAKTPVERHLEGDAIRHIEESGMFSPRPYEDRVESLLGDTKRRVSQPDFERIDLLLPAKTTAV